MSDTATESAAIPVPEPDLTPREIIARAAAMRETLRERQADTEERTFYSEETHKAFTDAGFYRILQPRRFGGYEFDLPTYYRVVMELCRGDISAGWCFCLGAAHVLQVSSMYDERAQAEFFGPDGHFICASFGFPVGVAQPRDGGYVLDGTWPYASGIPYSTHFMGQTLLNPGDMTDPGLMFVIPAEQFERMDDWGDVLGLLGSGSHSVKISEQWIPEHWTVREIMVDLQVDGGTPGSRLHNNPMYAGRTLGFFGGEFSAIMTGAAYAALDEYEHLIRTKSFAWDPRMKRMELIDYQRRMGLAMAQIGCAEAAAVQIGHQWMELARRNVEEGIPYSAEDDGRLQLMADHAARIAWKTMEDMLYPTAGSSSSRDGQRMQRYWRDMSTYWSHNTPAQRELLATRLGRMHLGLPLDLPGMLPVRNSG
jgi:3-hydroxy-9,10-secoandrosta-1,3,5(10)-triene-9,17-dione monooxygenase